MFATCHKDLLVKQYLKPKLLCKVPNALTISRSGQMGRASPCLNPTIHSCPGILCAPAAGCLSAVCSVCHAPFGPFPCAASCSWKLSIPSLLSYFNPAHASHLSSDVTSFEKAFFDPLGGSTRPLPFSWLTHTLKGLSDQHVYPTRGKFPKSRNQACNCSL